MANGGEQGYCQLMSNVYPATREECAELNGHWTRNNPQVGGVCVVATATAAVGSLDNADVRYLRQLRDDIVARDDTAANLWRKYSPLYYELAVPIVDRIRREPAASRLLVTFVIGPVLQTLRATATHLRTGNDDAAVRAVVDQGVERFRADLTDLGGQNGTQLARSVLSAVQEVEQDVSRAGRSAGRMS